MNLITRYRQPLLSYSLFHTDRHTGLESELQIIIVHSYFFKQLPNQRFIKYKNPIKELQKFIKAQPDGITQFDEVLARKLLSQITVHSDYLEFKFKSGVAVSVEK